MELDVTRAAAIQGWMTIPELQWLARQGQAHTVIVEIGSFLGRSTTALALYTAGVVYAVDDWLGTADYPRANPFVKPLEASRDAFERFSRNVGELVAAGKIVPMRTNHAIAPWDGPPIDLCFIDGHHSAESVARDIALWSPRLAPGALLCGHDIDQDQVSDGVRAELGAFDVVPNTTIWRRR